MLPSKSPCPHQRASDRFIALGPWLKRRPGKGGLQSPCIWTVRQASMPNKLSEGPSTSSGPAPKACQGRQIVIDGKCIVRGGTVLSWPSKVLCARLDGRCGWALSLGMTKLLANEGRGSHAHVCCRRWRRRSEPLGLVMLLGNTAGHKQSQTQNRLQCLHREPDACLKGSPDLSNTPTSPWR